SAAEADRFHRRLINACIQANYRPGNARGQLRVVIVGAGATGVELAAELRNTTRVLAAYGLQNIDPERFLHITLLNADPRILPLPRLRFSRVARPIQHYRFADGFSLRQELPRRGLVRAADVPVAVQDAPVRAPRSCRRRARYLGATPQTRH